MSADHGGKTTLRLELAATLEEIDRAARAADRALEGVLDRHARFGLLLGLREALANAVLHGSAANPEKTVTCDILIDSDMIVFEVSDQGEGFSWRNLATGFPEPTVPGSRGLGIIENYFDECKYNEKGNKLLLTKRRLC